MNHKSAPFSNWFVAEQDRKQIHPQSQEVHQLFSKRQFNLWMEGLVDFLNKNNEVPVTWAALLHQWSVEQLHVVLDYFSNPQFAALVNAIFFYKFHPDKLFTEVIHPEKLISVQMRLGVLHHYIELIQQQLYRVALKNDLTPAVDYFLHNEEPPQGIFIEIHEEHRQLIQAAVKKLRINVSLSQEKPEAGDWLYNLMRAYKFSFNPNRLIDAVMMLQQSLLSEVIEHEQRSVIFREKMVILYHQRSSAECLDLYGYFANEDTRCLLNTFYKFVQGSTFDWLPILNTEERITVLNVFDALSCVLEALRIELKNRNLLAAPYRYDLANPNIDVSESNRNAVFRVLSIYQQLKVIPDNVIEQLFQSIECSD
ncbi:hypothetical protein OQJ13_07195 [Legionella sp. PATHC035]|uniref:hypothetical protein n=1 Tax=Legionella sp. PATHC035 TaxID=2992040 RepID=UPI002244D22B|nr:hypothetical protein [Legionella sp. PATHC035]MCW8408755.1 hypothetical protein [Legionella sp. PATHC035]